MESDLLRRSLQVVSAVPGAAVAAVEAVARGTRVGEGRIDVALAIELQVPRAAREGQLAPVERRAALALGDQARAGFPLEFGEDGGLVVGVDPAAQHRGLVTGLGDQPRSEEHTAELQSLMR